MVVGAKVCELRDDFLWFVCGLHVGILTSPLTMSQRISSENSFVFKRGRPATRVRKSGLELCLVLFMYTVCISLSCDILI